MTPINLSAPSSYFWYWTVVLALLGLVEGGQLVLLYLIYKKMG